MPHHFNFNNNFLLLQTAGNMNQEMVLVDLMYNFFIDRSGYNAHLRSITKKAAAVWGAAATDSLLVAEAVKVVVKRQLSPCNAHRNINISSLFFLKNTQICKQSTCFVSK